MKTYLITGATGYIGSMLTNYILSRTDSQASEAQVTALVRNQDKATSMFPPEQYPQECLQFVCADLTDEAAMAQIDGKYDYIIHCAAVTKSAEMIAHPTEVIDGIVNGTRNIMELAHRCHAKSVVYLSSMEVYGDIDCSDGHRVSETELGFVDILNVRSCYPMSKRMAETICYSYFKEYGVPVKIARLAQTFGTGLLPGKTGCLPSLQMRHMGGRI